MSQTLYSPPEVRRFSLLSTLLNCKLSLDKITPPSECLFAVGLPHSTATPYVSVPCTHSLRSLILPSSQGCHLILHLRASSANLRSLSSFADCADLEFRLVPLSKSSATLVESSKASEEVPKWDNSQNLKLQATNDDIYIHSIQSLQPLRPQISSA